MEYGANNGGFTLYAAESFTTSAMKRAYIAVATAMDA
jgi:hypothetical protein